MINFYKRLFLCVSIGETARILSEVPSKFFGQSFKNELIKLFESIVLFLKIFYACQIIMYTFKFLDEFLLLSESFKYLFDLWIHIFLFIFVYNLLRFNGAWFI